MEAASIEVTQRDVVGKKVSSLRKTALSRFISMEDQKDPCPYKEPRQLL